MIVRKLGTTARAVVGFYTCFLLSFVRMELEWFADGRKKGKLVFQNKHVSLLYFLAG